MVIVSPVEVTVRSEVEQSGLLGRVSQGQAYTRCQRSPRPNHAVSSGGIVLSLVLSLSLLAAAIYPHPVVDPYPVVVN